MEDRRFYVYGYLRAEGSEHGVKGSYYYIGKGHGNRAHHRSTHAVKLPGDKANIFVIASGMTERDAFQAEMLLIYLHGRIDRKTGCLRNKTDGGDGFVGYVYTEVHRAKLRGNKRGCANKGKRRSKEFCLAMGEMKRGKKLRSHSEESRQRVSRSLMGHLVSDDTRDKQKLAKMSMSEEARKAWVEKLGSKHKGVSPSEETRKKRGESITRAWRVKAEREGREFVSYKEKKCINLI